MIKILKKAFRPIKNEIKHVEAYLWSVALKKDYAYRAIKYVLATKAKRIRAALVLLITPQHIKERIELATAVELLHLASLIHDDVVDRAVIRRKKKTLWKKMGEDYALLAGDYIYSTAFEVASKIKSSYVLNILSNTTVRMCEGEIGQLKNRFNVNVKLDDYTSYIEKKTASLFAAACHLAGYISGEYEDEFWRYGLYYGIAYQIFDDINDYIARISEKDKFNDLKNGRYTLPVIATINKLSKKERGEFFDAIKNENINRILKTIRLKNGFALAKTYALSYMRKAENSIKNINHNHKSNLILLTHSLDSTKV